MTSERVKSFSDKGFHYCFVLTNHGWRNQGMVPDNNRKPFIDEYKSTKGTRVAFSQFCWKENPNVFTDSEIYSYCDGSY